MVILLPLIIVSALVLYFHLLSKNRQREMLIEKGINPDGISVLEFQKAESLTNGVLFVSIGMGLLLGYVINATVKTKDFFIIYLIATFTTTGIGFLINYQIFKSVQKKHDERVD